MEQMQRVHYQKKTSPDKGEYYEYHRSDDDLAAAVEMAIEVIDGKASASAQSYYAGRQSYGGVVAGGGKEWGIR